MVLDEFNNKNKHSINQLVAKKQLMRRHLNATQKYKKNQTAQ